MDFSSLSEKTRLEALKNSKYALMQELYVTLVRLNIDPDTFIMEEWVEPTPVSTHDQHRVTELIESLQFTNNKLAELE